MRPGCRDIPESLSGNGNEMPRPMPRDFLMARARASTKAVVSRVAGSPLVSLPSEAKELARQAASASANSGQTEGWKVYAGASIEAVKAEGVSIATREKGYKRGRP